MPVTTQYIAVNPTLVSGTSWSNLDRAVGSTSGNYATWQSSTPEATSILDCFFTFSASIPSGATIDSITIRVKAYMSSTSHADDAFYRLRDGTTLFGTSQQIQETTDSGNIHTYTFSTGLPTTAQVRSANFKVRFEARKEDTSTSATTSLDWIEIAVTWSGGVLDTLSGAGTLSFPTQTPRPASTLAFSGAGTWTAPTRTPALVAALALAGSGTISPAPPVPGNMALAGSGQLSFPTRVTGLTGACALSGSGTLSFTRGNMTIVKALALSGAGTQLLYKVTQGTLALSGSGTLTFAGGPRQGGRVFLAGDGTLTLTTGAILGGTYYGVAVPLGVSSWTWNWWLTLPAAYRLADTKQNPEIGAFPLLRFMEGIGHVAADIRAVSDGVWFGSIMDPIMTADSNLRWIAQMLGVSASQRSMPAPELRAYINDLVVSGLPAVGTKQSITDAAKRFLVGTKMTTVLADPTNEHRLILLVKASDVPGGDLIAYQAAVRATGIIPAGFIITAVAAAASWDEWMSEAGPTWDNRESNVPTWTIADSLGVEGL